MSIDIASRTPEGLAADFAGMGLPAYRARQVFAWLHRRGADTFGQMTDLPAALRGQLAESCHIGGAAVEGRRCSGLDATRKYLLGLRDGNRVEAVWMEYRHGNTVCVSTQAGCRMGCTFCASAIGGLERGLTAGEMLGEVYALERDTGKRAGGVVLMGIGEPLDNFGPVVDFLRLISSPEGRGIGLRHVSLSTCGLVPEIDRLAEYGFPLTLSVSLHAPDDETRGRLMPINRRYPVRELMEACQRYFAKTGRRISFEYALIGSVNDTPDHARQLCRLLRGTGMPCHVNLIPVNEVRGPDGHGCRRGGRERMEAFRAALAHGGINATVRRELGADISAACGQLRRDSAGWAAAKGGHEGA